MLIVRGIVTFSCCTSLAVAVRIPDSPTTLTFFQRHDSRPILMVPTLTEVRAIMARLQGPIISALISRAALPAEPTLYSDEGRSLTSFMHQKEVAARSTGRYIYGSLEYPFTLPIVAPDIVGPTTEYFPEGRFHQDTNSPNCELSSFYLKTLMPLLQDANSAQRSSVFFHLAAPTDVADTDAKYTLDAQLLALLSHRASLGKIVAESKYAANATGYTPVIKSKDANSIRVLLTNATQEQIVLNTAANASFSLATAWTIAQTMSPEISKDFVDRIQEAVAKVYRKLMDITTEVEVQYLLQRLD